MTFNELKEFVEEHDLSSELDEFVHDLKAQEAAEINNNGAHSQLDYLLQGLAMDDLVKIVKQMKEGKE